jgi:hypothetical protein
VAGPFPDEVAPVADPLLFDPLELHAAAVSAQARAAETVSGRPQCLFLVILLSSRPVKEWSAG